MSASRLVGVLLAAGQGSRMGQTKQLIELPVATGPSQPLIALAFDSIATACQRMVVVVDHDKDRVVDSLGSRVFSIAEVPGTRQMSESAVAGLRVASSNWPGNSVLLQLGDHPDVRPETLTRLRNESTKHPTRTIIPTFHGKGGHPVLIPPEMIERLLSESRPAALNAFWRRHPDHCVRCEVEDAAVIHDLDNPTQLADEVQRRSNS